MFSFHCRWLKPTAMNIFKHVIWINKIINLPGALLNFPGIGFFFGLIMPPAQYPREAQCNARFMPR
jgi:hypothetical protein